jgi:hypothetical protein
VSTGPGVFRKSSYSGSSTNCVEVATAGTVRVRDSKDPGGPELAFTRAGWQEFTAAVRRSPAPDRGPPSGPPLEPLDMPDLSALLPGAEAAPGDSVLGHALRRALADPGPADPIATHDSYMGPFH